MYLDLYGTPSRVCEEATLRAPLSVAWEYEAKDNVGLCPVVERLILLWSSDALVALQADGRPAWRVSGNFSDGVRILGDVVLTGGREKEQRDAWKYWDLASGHMLRQEKCGGSIRALVGDVVIALNYEEPTAEEVRPVWLCAFRVGNDSPELLWKRKSHSRDDGFSNLLACTSEAVFLGAGVRIVACDLLDGAEMWKASAADLGGDLVLDAHPMVTRGICVVATKAWTAAFDAKTGQRLWSTPIWGPHVVYADRVYVIQHDTLYAFDLFDGSLRLQQEIATEMEKKGRKKFDRLSTHIAATDTHLWGGDPYGTLWAFNRETGRPEWHHRPKNTTGYSGSVPAISGSRLYISSFSMDARFPPTLYCYEQA